MRPVAGWIVIATLFATLSTPSAAPQSQDHTDRKTLNRAVPLYPAVAKRMQLGGVVKLEVVVRPDGKVKSVIPLGGSPIFIQAATDAVQKWRFESAPGETTQMVQVVFDSSQ